jgi:cytochrome c peroxidase
MTNKYQRPTSIPFPADNAYTRERETLGRLLFFDPRLSRSNVISCGTLP